MTKPEPSFEWEITTKCNYHCSYCCQKAYQLQVSKHCSDEIIDAVYDLLGKLPGQWLIKVIGGEPMIHPRFAEICRQITTHGHRLAMTTNFSLPARRLEQLIAETGDKLAYITASLHLEQVRSLDEFVEKAIAFNAAKHPATDFVVTSVALEETFETLKGVSERLEAAGVRFAFQALKIDGQYVAYSNPEIEPYLRGRLIDNTDMIRGLSLYGTKCHTGQLFFRVSVTGQATRCYNPQPLYDLGNVTDGAFKLFDRPWPCLSPVCTCTVPANRGMILYGQKASQAEIAAAHIKGRLREAKTRVTRRLTMSTGGQQKPAGS